MSPADETPLVHDQNQRSSRHFAKVAGCTSLELDDDGWDNTEEVENILECLRSKSSVELSNIESIIEPEFIFEKVAKDVGENAVSFIVYLLFIKSL